jgi:hypothetical protein
VTIGRRRFISARAIAAFIAASSTTEAPEGGLGSAAQAVRMRMGWVSPRTGGEERREFVPLGKVARQSGPDVYSRADLCAQ